MPSLPGLWVSCCYCCSPASLHQGRPATSVPPCPQEGEHPSLAKPVTENLNAVLQLLQYSEVLGAGHFAASGAPNADAMPSPCHCATFAVTRPTLAPRQVRELSLSGNQLRSEALQRRLRFQAGDSLTNSSWLEGPAGGGVAEQDDVDEGVAALRAAAEVIDCSSECLGLRGSGEGGDGCQVTWVAAEQERIGSNALATWRLLPVRAGGCRNGELLVTLKPMEVRTFELVYRPA